MPVKGSANYVWFIDQLLGTGATGQVYRGRHKKTGELCAVKIINTATHSRLASIQSRELEVMTKLDHKNIVKLLAVENETQGREKVIVMELCEGGSVYSMLDEPEHHYGFPEDEFVKFLRDIASGMQYLHTNGIVHRDVKPGNILRYITIDDQSVFKLTDFGGARQLTHEEENFTSMFGTEEYLHPDMYERALLNGPRDKAFDATVDLWSVGVTIYHVATGQLPFRPYGGRKNKEAMHIITSKKNPGVISGVQYAAHADIEYSNQLPKTCRLSQGIKTIVTPILAGLLENDPRRKCSFFDFFEQVNKLMSLVTVFVFSLPTFSHIRIYAAKTDKLTHLQERLAEQTEIRAPDQILIFKGSMFDEVVEPVTPISEYPQTTPSSPIIVFTSSDSWHMSRPAIPEIHLDPDPSSNGDYIFAKRYCGVTYYLHNVIEELVSGLRLLRDAANYTSLLTKTWFNGTRAILSECWKTVDETIKRKEFLCESSEDRLSDWKLSNQIPHALYDQVESDIRAKLQELERFAAKIKENKRKVNGFNSSLFEKFGKMTESMSQQLNIDIEDDNCKSRSRANVKELKRIYLQFKDDRKRVLTYNEDQIHKYEKYRIKDIYALESSLSDSVWTNQVMTVYKRAKSNICLLWKYREKISAVEKEGGKIDDDVAKLSHHLSEVQYIVRQHFHSLRASGARPCRTSLSQGYHTGPYSDPTYARASTLPRTVVDDSGVVEGSDSFPSTTAGLQSSASTASSLSQRQRSDGPAIKLLELRQSLNMLVENSGKVAYDIEENNRMLASVQGALTDENNIALDERQGDGVDNFR